MANRSASTRNGRTACLSTTRRRGCRCCCGPAALHRPWCRPGRQLADVMPTVLEMVGVRPRSPATGAASGRGGARPDRRGRRRLPRSAQRQPHPALGAAHRARRRATEIHRLARGRSSPIWWPTRASRNLFHAAQPRRGRRWPRRLFAMRGAAAAGGDPRPLTPRRNGACVRSATVPGAGGPATGASGNGGRRSQGAGRPAQRPRRRARRREGGRRGPRPSAC